MKIIPSIDIIDGQCVRLKQGDFAQKSTYPTKPQEMAVLFKEAGATVLHVVDLEGSKNGKITQWSTIQEIVDAFGGTVQVGGGVRTSDDVEQLLSVGVSRVVVGTKAQQLASDWIKIYGSEAIVLALDFKISKNLFPKFDESNIVPFIYIAGWTQDTLNTVWDILERCPKAKHVLCTDIGRDGMQQGPSMDFYREFVRRHPTIELQASGGVGSIEDIQTLASFGVSGAIVGKAIYEEKISLQEAISCLK